MARETKTVIIGDTKYEIHSIPATPALEIGLELSKALAPGLALFADLRGKKGEEEVTGEMLQKVAEAIFKDMDCPKTVALIKRLMGSVTAEGVGVVSGVFDTHFAGRLGSLFKVLKEVIAHNFSDFFSEVAALI